MTDADVALCADCATPLGKARQLSLEGFVVPERCVDCATRRRTKHMLATVPAEGDRAFAKLSEREQDFLRSLRRQAQRGPRWLPSEAQYRWLEDIYGRF